MSVRVYEGHNPSQLYMDALVDLHFNGDEVAPRGKRIKELRPAIFQFKNPLNRVTYLKGRVINPFFQLAEALWILAGRSDVEWLTDYNKSIGQFSDDGVYFNAPYGERLTYYNKCDALGADWAGKTIDQLLDVYRKIKADPDTRQAVAVIYNPVFDNASIKTKDRPCNLLLTFKLRNGELDLSVYNRSNDIHWGTFGANLCQFSTILEVMASWLQVKVGSYYQITDSLHMYLDDYGAEETNKVFKAYGNVIQDNYELIPSVKDLSLTPDQEPRMSLSCEGFHKELWNYFNTTDLMMRDEYTYSNGIEWAQMMMMIDNCKDEYFKLTYLAMAAYQAHKKGAKPKMVAALWSMPLCGWKISCLRFLHKTYKDYPAFVQLYKDFDSTLVDYIERKGE